MRDRNGGSTYLRSNVMTCATSMLVPQFDWRSVDIVAVSFRNVEVNAVVDIGIDVVIPVSLDNVFTGYSRPL